MEIRLEALELLQTYMRNFVTSLFDHIKNNRCLEDNTCSARVPLGAIALLIFYSGCRLEHRTGELPFSLISSLLSLIPPGDCRDNILEYVMNTSSHTLVDSSFTSFLSFHPTLLSVYKYTNQLIICTTFYSLLYSYALKVIVYGI
jgi:hypothetical protein